VPKRHAIGQLLAVTYKRPLAARSERNQELPRQNLWDFSCSCRTCGPTGRTENKVGMSVNFVGK